MLHRMFTHKRNNRGRGRGGAKGLGMIIAARFRVHTISLQNKLPIPKYQAKDRIAFPENVKS